MKKIFLLVTLLSIFYISYIKPIIPETIATATLIKYGGLGAAVAIGGRYVATATKELSQNFNMRLNTYPNSEFYTREQCNPSEYQYSKIKEVSTKSEPEVNWFKKVKDMVGSKYNKQQKFKEEIRFDRTNDMHSEELNSYHQTYIHAQQARGLFPKINNYYYPKDHVSAKSFWQGVTAGSFITGMTSLYLVLKVKKD